MDSRPARQTPLLAALVMAATMVAAPVPSLAAASCDGLTATIIGTPGPDSLEGTPGPDVIAGLGGDDVIRGRGGDDVVCGGDGDDRIVAGPGDDTVHGEEGHDRVRGGSGSDTIHGGSGNDRLHGDRGDDVLWGGLGADRITGAGGADTAAGGGGADVLTGGPGDDHLIGGAGGNVLDGGGDDDVLDGGPDPDALLGGEGDDRLRGEGGSDLLVGGIGHDVLRGGASTPFGRVCPPTGCVDLAGDDLRGGDGRDVLSGGDGPDRLQGGNDGDRLAGGDGDDDLSGGGDDDLLSGGRGADTGRGGPGLDACTRIEALEDECPPPVSAEVQAWVGSTDARRLARTLQDLIAHQTACDGSTGDLERLDALTAGAPVEIRAHLEGAATELRASAAACNVAPFAWQSHLEAATGHLAAMAGWFDGAAPRRAPTLLETTSRASQALEAATDYLHGFTVKMRTTNLWFGRPHYGKSLDLAISAGAGETFEVVMVGSSMTQDASDPVRFSAVDGRSAFNAAIPSFAPELIDRHLREQLLDEVSPSLVIYGMAPRDVVVKDEVAGSCLDSTARWERAMSARETVFSPVTAAEGYSWRQLLFGDPVTHEPNRVYRAEINRFGGREFYDQASAAEIKAAAARQAQDGPFPICAERIDVMAGTISWLVGEGIDVVVVALPLSPHLVAGFQGGQAEVDGILADIAAAATGAGATWIDLSASLVDGQFRDVVHANRTGSEIYTDALVARLADLGI